MEQKPAPQTSNKLDELYKKKLEEAKNENFSLFESNGLIRIQGADKEKRPCIVIDYSRFPKPEDTKMHIDSFYLYFIRTLDEVVEREYVIAFIHTEGIVNLPSSAQISRWYASLPYKYSTNLFRFYFVNWNIWTSFYTNLFLPVVSWNLWLKFVQVSSVDDLNKRMSTPVEISPPVKGNSEPGAEGDEQA